jgi:hypothetical protein
VIFSSFLFKFKVYSHLFFGHCNSRHKNIYFYNKIMRHKLCNRIPKLMSKKNLFFVLYKTPSLIFNQIDLYIDVDAYRVTLLPVESILKDFIKRYKLGFPITIAIAWESRLANFITNSNQIIMTAKMMTILGRSCFSGRVRKMLSKKMIASIFSILEKKSWMLASIS